MNRLTATTLAAHFPAVAPEIFRALKNEKPLTDATVKGKEGKPSMNMPFPLITTDIPAQLPPLAAKLDDMASHLARIAGTVERDPEEHLVILTHNLADLAEQVAHMEMNLEVSA